MDGIVNVHKTEGPTSHDVVAEIRRIFGQKKVGHAGTLDPMATGVLVVCLGKGTRVVEYLMGTSKEYRAKLVLGISTDTQDRTGTVTAEQDASSVTREMLEDAARAFVGEIEQVPPMTSAIKRDGKPLYKLAHAGITVDREPRKVTVYSIDVTGFRDLGPLKEADLTINCSSGTYIRTLCSDIGDKLGVGGHMAALERTRVGRFCIDSAVTTDQLHEAKSEDRLEACVLGIDEAVADLPAAMVGRMDVGRVMHGNTVAVAALEAEGDVYRIISPDGALLAIGQLCNEPGGPVVKPHKVLTEA